MSALKEIRIAMDNAHRKMDISLGAREELLSESQVPHETHLSNLYISGPRVSINPLGVKQVIVYVCESIENELC